MVSMYFREWIIQPGVNAPILYFEVKGGLSDSPYWLARRPGILAPLLKWNVEKVD
jgi:lipopolysaccharide transport system ATP-binding protein